MVTLTPQEYDALAHPRAFNREQAEAAEQSEANVKILRNRAIADLRASNRAMTWTDAYQQVRALSPELFNLAPRGEAPAPAQETALGNRDDLALVSNRRLAVEEYTEKNHVSFEVAWNRMRDLDPAAFGVETATEGQEETERLHNRERLQTANAINDGIRNIRAVFPRWSYSECRNELRRRNPKLFGC